MSKFVFNPYESPPTKQLSGAASLLLGRCYVPYKFWHTIIILLIFLTTKRFSKWSFESAIWENFLEISNNALFKIKEESWQNQVDLNLNFNYISKIKLNNNVNLVHTWPHALWYMACNLCLLYAIFALCACRKWYCHLAHYNIISCLNVKYLYQGLIILLVNFDMIIHHWEVKSLFAFCFSTFGLTLVLHLIFLWVLHKFICPLFIWLEVCQQFLYTCIAVHSPAFVLALSPIFAFGLSVNLQITLP